jgi:hypothetical protein
MKKKYIEINQIAIISIINNHGHNRIRNPKDLLGLNEPETYTSVGHISVSIGLFVYHIR